MLVLQDISRVKNLNGLTNEKVPCNYACYALDERSSFFSDNYITRRLPSDTRTQIEKITTEKAIKGEIKEVSEYANLGKEIGVAVNETLKAVEDSAIRIADSNLGQTAITIVVWKLLYKEIAGVVIGIILLGISLFMLLTGRGKLSKNDEDAGGWTSVVGGAVFFISSMICIFG